MAARLNNRHQDLVREKIRASQLINRLQNYALGNPSTKAFKKQVMSDGQVRAAMGLLAKCLPDLQRAEITGEGGKPLQVHIVRFSDPTAEQLAAARVSEGALASPGTGMPPRRVVLAQEVGEG